MANERVRRSIEFQYGVSADDLIKGTEIAENSIAGLEAKLKKLREEFEGTEIGSDQFRKLGSEIQATESRIKTLNTAIEGLTAEQKAAAIVDSFNAVAGAIGVVSGTLVTLGIKSDALDEVEKRLLGIISVVTGLQAVSKGLESIGKVAPGVTAAIGKATAAIRAFALANPFTAVAATVVALTAAVYALVKANEEEKKSVEDLTKAYDDYAKINERRAENREKEAEIQIERTKLQGDELKAAEDALQLAKDRLEQDEIDLLVYQAKQDENESALTVLEDQVKAAQRMVELSEDEAFYGTSIWENREKYREELKKANVALEEFQQREINLQQKIEQSTNAVLQAEKDLEAVREANRKKAEEAQKKRDEAAEKLAIRAVKQLESQRQAEQDLIDLYEQFPEFIGEGAKGQFEFNTELDKTNFLLAEQLDVLYTLRQVYPNLFPEFVYQQKLATMSVEEFNEELERTQEELDDLTKGFEKFYSQEQLAVFKKLRDANKTQLQLQLDDLENQYRSELALFSDNEEMKSKITEQYEKDRAKLRRQYAIQVAGDLIGVTSQFLGTIAQINQASLELQLAQAAGNQAAIERINAEALEKQKKLRIAQTIVTTAESILNGYNATSTLPPPFNLIAGTALAAAYTALGAKTIQTISSTTLDSSAGATGGGFNNIPGGGFGSINIPGGGGISTTPSLGAVLPGLGGGRVVNAPGLGTINEAPQEPIRAYVLAGDVSNGVQANIALNTRRRLAGG